LNDAKESEIIDLSIRPLILLLLYRKNEKQIRFLILATGAKLK
jgi:hypothetical protein